MCNKNGGVQGGRRSDSTCGHGLSQKDDEGKTVASNLLVAEQYSQRYTRIKSTECSTVSTGETTGVPTLYRSIEPTGRRSPIYSQRYTRFEPI